MKTAGAKDVHVLGASGFCRRLERRPLPFMDSTFRAHAYIIGRLSLNRNDSASGFGGHYFLPTNVRAAMQIASTPVFSVGCKTGAK